MFDFFDLLSFAAPLFVGFLVGLLLGWRIGFHESDAENEKLRAERDWLLQQWADAQGEGRNHG